MYLPLHRALSRIPVAKGTALDRQNERFTQFIGGATRILAEAAVESLPFTTKSDIRALWTRVKGKLPGTSPEVADAVHVFLDMVRSEPFGTDVLGLYWAAHGPDGGRDIARIVLEQVEALGVVDELPAGFSEGLDVDAGIFGRIALDVMRRIGERADLDLAAIWFVIQGGPDHRAVAATVALLAACLVHGCLPGQLVVLAEDDELVFHLAALLPGTASIPH